MERHAADDQRKQLFREASENELFVQILVPFLSKRVSLYNQEEIKGGSFYTAIKSNQITLLFATDCFYLSFFLFKDMKDNNSMRLICW